MNVKILIFLLFQLAILITFCPENVIFDNPDDPSSPNYIASEFLCDTILRVNLTTAKIHFGWDQEDQDIGSVNCERSIMVAGNSTLDKIFKIQLTDLRLFNNRIYEWIDTSLSIGRDYEYKFAFVTKKGVVSNKRFIKKYSHRFRKPNYVIKQTSDTSISIRLITWDNLASLLKIDWFSGNFATATGTLPLGSQTNLLDCPNGSNKLDSNLFIIHLGTIIADSAIWNPVDTISMVFNFPKVTDLKAIRFDTNIVRLSWLYNNADEVQPTLFKIYQNNDLVTNIDVNSIQWILDKKYFVFYYDNSGIGGFSISASTKYHESKQVTENVSAINTDYHRYYFVDYGEYGNGFYLGKFEISNAEFCGWVKTKTTINYQDSLRILIDFSQTDFDDNFTYKTGTGNKPVHGIPFDVAQKYAIESGGALLTLDEWESAAQGSDLVNTRSYPWGNDAPNSTYVLYNQSNIITWDVNQGEKGRVLINSKYNIYGAYNMAGNVCEWVNDSTICYYGRLPKISTGWRATKGGSWGSPLEYLEVKESLCFPVNVSYQGIGFRIKKPLY